MAIIKMQWSQAEDDYGTHRASVTTTGTSDPVMMVYSASKTTAAIYPTDQAKVQHTISTPAEIEAGTAEWIDWDKGKVRVNTSDSLIGTVTAIRAVALSGSVDMEVIAR